ncbi:MAG TPA: DNA primase [Tenericutes bacterium]|nr:DNA primase [Mycoplasmatota bacterium]
MNFISDEKINEIRNSIDIVELIGRYIPLTPRGKNYFGVCPFHDDHSPSMSVSKDKQIYKCFSCGAIGNVFKFIMDYENVSFVESVSKIADIVGINIDLRYKSNISKKENNVLYDIYDLSLKFYQNNLNTINGNSAREYLLNRNIDADVIKEFGIGLALKDRTLLTKILINKEFDKKRILDSGLVLNGENGMYDIYYNRIMFPIHNLYGQVVGYSGRIYDNSDNSKYINTKETEIFKKSELLYNYHRSKDISRQKNVVIVMEGFLDVIRAYTIGIKNTVATMGTAITKDHALTLKKMAKEIILCFDGDSAGAKATNSCINELLKVGVRPKIVRLEENLDPDDYILKYGKERFLSKIENPVNIMDFKISYLKEGKNLNSDEEVSIYVNSILEELKSIDDEILTKLTIKKISEETGLDIDFLEDKVNENKIDNKKKIVKTNKNVKTVKLSKYVKAEQYLIFYMLRSKDVIKIYNKKITYMPTDRYRLFAREIATFYKIYNNINIADFITFLNNKTELMETLKEINSLNLKDEFSYEEIDDYINVIKEYNIKYVLNKYMKQLEQETDPIKKAEIGQKIIEVKLSQDR